MQLYESYTASESRYERSDFYRRCGNSGLMLPRLSFGLWHNFGNITPLGVQQQILRTAFDAGITHFDLANNYGPPYGEAETNFGILMDRDWRPYRDELIISTKARMHLDYVDIFYHHRPDPETPLEETMGALKTIVDSGRALYVGISNYPADRAKQAAEIMKAWGVPLLICQSRYNMFTRNIEDELLGTLAREDMGCIVFQPLAGGLLTDKYIHGIPADSRAAHDPRYLKPDMITEEKIARVVKLNELAAKRGESLAQMALQWVLRDVRVTSALIGASRPEQIRENIKALQFPDFSAEELQAINAILA